MKLLMGKGLTHTPEESEVAIGKSNYETRRNPSTAKEIRSSSLRRHPLL
jgi:hypothetical protein